MRSAIASAVKPQWSWMTSKRRRWAAMSIASNARATWSTSYSERSISSGWGASSSVTTVALETDPGAQNRVTSWPRRTRASVRTCTTSSTPPYPGGGTAIHGGASIAIRSGAPDAGPRVLSTVRGRSRSCRRLRAGATPAGSMLARPRARAGPAAPSSEVNKEQSAGDGGRSRPARRGRVSCACLRDQSCEPLSGRDGRNLRRPKAWRSASVDQAQRSLRAGRPSCAAAPARLFLGSHWCLAGIAQAWFVSLARRSAAARLACRGGHGRPPLCPSDESRWGSEKS